ncbi:hypothetical protein AB0758_24475 [Tolypothrix bouteillei VB521301_2]|uniref:hypothetical protein n=1 Tax=Tolypothrix bouteillei TaxID=1246981 RepID=UPI0038B57709
MSASSRLNPQEELTEIEQQIIANCQRLTSLLGLSETNQITLTVNLILIPTPTRDKSTAVL